MFWGECEFKTQMPDNVMMKGYTKYIKSKTDVLFTDEEVDQICEAIRTGRLPANWTTKQQHLQSLKERHNSETCPKCGSELVLRTAKKGQNAGKQFYGCSGFPACRYARPK
jgi:restriction system protein